MMGLFSIKCPMSGITYEHTRDLTEVLSGFTWHIEPTCPCSSFLLGCQRFLFGHMLGWLGWHRGHGRPGRWTLKSRTFFCWVTECWSVYWMNAHTLAPFWNIAEVVIVLLVLWHLGVNGASLPVAYKSSSQTTSSFPCFSRIQARSSKKQMLR